MTWLTGLREPRDVPALGLFVKIPAPEVSEIVARSGVDFVVIDTEHALLSVRDVYEMLVVYAGLGVAPLVRVTDHGYGDAQRYLDAGAEGILVPHVTSGAVARQVAEQLSFPPRGTRGMGYASRAGQWGGLAGGAAEYLRRGQEDIARVAMVEDSAGVGAVGEIAGADGIDAVFVGSGDLSVSLGVPMGDPEVMRVVDTVVEQTVAAGVPVGTIVSSPEQSRRRAAQGCSFLLVGNDTGLLRTACTTTLTTHHEALRT